MINYKYGTSFAKIIDLTPHIWYNNRMLTEKLQKIYRETGADALYTTTDYLRRYLTGFYSTDGFVISDDKGSTFVADLRYAEAAEKALEGTGIKLEVGAYDRAQELLEPYMKLGVPFDLISYQEAKKLTDAPADKVTVSFGLDNERGALYRMLGIFARLGINMSKIESRPDKSNPAKYYFVADLEGNCGSPEMKCALSAARSASHDFRFLGEYRKGRLQ